LKQFLSTYLTRLCLATYRRPAKTLVLLFVTFLCAVLYGSQNLRLELAWTYLFEPDDPVVVEFEAAREKFPYPGDIAVLVDQGTAEEREAYLELLAERLAQEPETFHHILYRFDLQDFASRSLYFLNTELLEKLDAALERRGDSRGEDSSDFALRVQLKLLTDLKTALLTRGRSDLVPIWRLFADSEEGRFKESLIRLLGGERYLYTTMADGKVHALVFKGGTRGTELKAGGAEVGRIREVLEELQPFAYGLRTRLTGLPVMLYDEQQTCKQDTLRSGLLSLFFILAVFVATFGGVRKPLFSAAGLVCGLGWTLAYAALTVGHLNFITVTMVSMLLGLGIDFGVHFLFRYEEERRAGHGPEEAIALTAATTGTDTLVGATATSASFLALTATQFRGVSDLGVIASGGVLLCFLSTVLILPALLGLYPNTGKPQAALSVTLARLEGWLTTHYRAVCAITLGWLVVALFIAQKVGFRYNLLEVQAQEIASVRTERQLLRDYQTTVLSAAVLAADEEEARRLAARLRALSTVKSVGTITDLVPWGVDEKRPLVEKIVGEAQALRLPEPLALERAEDLLSLQEKFQEMEAPPSGSTESPKLKEAVGDVKSVLRGMQPGPIQDGLKSFQSALRNDAARLLALLKLQSDQPLSVEQLPENLRIRYLSPEGYYLLTVQPALDIWERENLERFLGEVKSAGVTLVGHPVIQSHILHSFDKAFHVTPWYTLLGVFSVMLLYLRRPVLVLLSSLPTALGVLFIFSAMGLVGEHFNVVNFVALPISVGIGAVYGVHSLHRIQEMGEERILNTSTGYAILVSGLTTIAGFASLMTAHHRGMASFGMVISLGVVGNLLVSLVVLPAVCRALRLYRLKKMTIRQVVDK